MKVFSVFCKAILGLAMYAWVALPASAQELQLDYKFTQGDHFQVKQHQQQDSYLTLDAGPQRTTNQTDANLSFMVQSVKGGEATLTVFYSEIILQVSARDEQVTVNTTLAPDDVYDRLFKLMIGEKFTMVLLNDGTIKSIQGLDAIFDKMIAGTPEVKEKEKSTLKQFLVSQFGPETLKSSLAFVLPHYPSSMVRTGDTWSNQLNTEGFYHGKIDNYWKLSYADKYMIKLTNKGKFNTDATEEVDLGQGQKGFVDLNGEVEGQYTLDPETHWPATCLVHTELKGKYIYKSPKKNKNNLEVPVRTVMDASYQFKHL